MADARKAALDAGSGRFLQVFADVGVQLQDVFGDVGVREVFEYDCPGWAVPLPKELVPEQVGTMPSDSLYVLLAERKAGITMHFWNPLSYTFLEEHAAWLKEAGFKPMRGCLQFNRKSAYPVEEVGRLLREARASWA